MENVLKMVFWAALGCAAVLAVGGIMGKELVAGFSGSLGQFGMALEELLPSGQEVKLKTEQSITSDAKENSNFQEITEEEKISVNNEIVSAVVPEKKSVPASQTLKMPQIIQPVQVAEPIMIVEPEAVPIVQEKPPISYPAIRIEQVQIGSSVSEKDEFVKLYNQTNQGVDLTGWYLQRKTKTADIFSTYAPRTILEGKIINAQGYFIIAREGMDIKADVFVDAPLTEDNILALKSPDGVIQDAYWIESSQLPELVIVSEQSPASSPEPQQNPTENNETGAVQTSDQNQSQGELYYTSSYKTAKYYYPASCNGWKSLSQSYLKSFNSLGELLATYPSKTLSPGCN